MPRKEVTLRCKLAGICTTCNTQIVQPGKTKCVRCLQKSRERNRTVRYPRIAAGLCRSESCNRPLVPYRTMCDYHLEQMSRRAAVRFEWRKQNRLCTMCGVELPEEIPRQRCCLCEEKHALVEMTGGYNQKSRLKEKLNADHSNYRPRDIRPVPVR